MTHVLVPTDFSPFGEIAVDAAFKMASKVECQIHVYHCADLPPGWTEWSEEDQKADEKLWSEAQKVQEKLEDIKRQGKEQGLQIVVSFSGGKLLTNLETIMVNEDVDLVIMGSHGSSGKKFFFGSNTQKVIRNLHVPVLVLKQALKDFCFPHVLFASGLYEEDQEVFLRLIEFARPFGLEELHVMSVDTASYFGQPTPVMSEALKKFEELAKPYPCKTHFFRDYSVEAGIRHLSEELKIDLIGISNKNRSPIKRIFQGSTVELLAIHSDMPVLSIDF